MTSTLFTLKEVCECTGGKLLPSGKKEPVGEVESRSVRKVVLDTRELQSGDLFVALQGERADGHRFLGDAEKKGAVAAVVSHDYTRRAPGVLESLPSIVVEDPLSALWELARENRNRNRNVVVVGITGSNGKTTTKEMLVSILRVAVGEDRVLCNRKSFNNHLGVPLTLLDLRPGHTYCVSELGMNAPGEIRDLTALSRPFLGVITSIGEAHLQGLGSVEGVARAKAELFQGLPPEGWAVMPWLAPGLMKILQEGAERLSDERGLVVGRGDKGEVRLTRAKAEADGRLECRIEGGGKQLEVTLPVVGEHNGMNATMAVTAARCLEVPDEEIVRGLAEFEPPPHRSVVKHIGGAVVLDDCYNANPTSMSAAMDTVSSLPGKGPLGALIGDMLELGASSEDHHRKLGAELARRGFEIVAFVGHASQAAALAARRQGMAEVNSPFFKNASRAGEFVSKRMGEGWRVLVKGSRRVALEDALEAWEREAKVPCRNKLVNSGRQGAPPARTEEQGNLNDSERRETPSAGMDRRSERSSYSCTGPNVLGEGSHRGGC